MTTLKLTPTEIELGMIVQLRKPHPCGGRDWRVVRLGADIGLVCLSCDHKVFLPRSKFVRQVKMVISSPR